MNNKKLSEIFHENTKLFLTEKSIEENEYPIAWKKIHFKTYPRFKKVKLPKKFSEENVSIKTILNKRRSIRKFSNLPLNLKEISNLLHYSAGISNKGIDINETYRTYPSAGARYPLEIYLVVFNSELTKGIYHYNVIEHSLELIKKGYFRSHIINFTQQDWVRGASAVLLISAIFDRTKIKYGERGYRYVFLDAGHLAQNLYLVSTSMNLGCCTIGGFFDDKINNLLDLDGIKESVIYLSVIGKII